MLCHSRQRATRSVTTGSFFGLVRTKPRRATWLPISAGVLLDSPLVDSEGCGNFGEWDAIGVSPYQRVDLRRVETSADTSRGSNFDRRGPVRDQFEDATNAFCPMQVPARPDRENQMQESTGKAIVCAGRTTRAV